VDHQALREAASRLNHDVHRAGLVILAFGNASVVDRSAGILAIKPSGLPCDAVAPSDIVLVDLATGEPRGSRLRPSSDTRTHLALYRALPGLGAVIHTHSPQATSWAQARRPIPCLGTTHADHFGGDVPVTRTLTPAEIGGDYEANTGLVIVELFGPGGLDPARIPAALVAGHGPFAWGPGAGDALEAAVALEAVARIATATLQVDPSCRGLEPELRERHHRRKHGPDATYGQRDATRP
jgi:L-ribulose-5-phosphate 4-epimerase